VILLVPLKFRFPMLVYMRSTRSSHHAAQLLNISVQVNESVLKKVIEWCEHHKNDPPATADDDSDSRKKTTDIEEWDQKFMQVDQEMLFEIILVSAVILPCAFISLTSYLGF
jgi:hypothetical protein